MDYIIWHGFYVAAGTPKDVIARLNRDVNTALQQPDVRERLAGLGMQVRTGAPELLGDYVRDEIKKWTEVGQAANIKVE
ncbi:MAG: tripartite tricarboxylate transporter substrate binding protein [Burkholderiales bacterium]|jgi:tripartite-type tricarboxylate transporter receptor subunit TctC|nr:tripartite tricarboxylate transporter substrate binding protein [Burkholderiales bacterium]